MRHEPFTDDLAEALHALGPEREWPPLRGRAEDNTPARPAIKAARFEWIEPSAIPVREWLLGRHLIRKFISATVSPGGIGKSSLVIAEALSMVTGRDLIGSQPHGRFKVWYINLEDPMDELQRRVMATALHYELDDSDLAGRLFVNSGRDTRVVVAEQNRAGLMIAHPVIEQIRATILANMIDVLIIDPFVSSHAVSENDNGAINAVATVWAEIADHCGCAVELVHHARKTGGNEVTVEDSRGASALLSKARAARVLNPMSREEGERLGVEQPRLHFRVDGGKANLAPPASDGSKWFKLASVPLGNGPPGLLDYGDSVGVVTAWEKPDPFESVTLADLQAAQAAVRAGGPWRENVQARDWVGMPIAHALRLNPDDRKDREKVKGLLRAWIGTGMFVVVTGMDEKHKPRPFVEVGRAASHEGD
ncbi:hypothetical protein AFCDBAGC_4907 [Methylobacterium cerastii]|uniref:Recombinase RecA n=1 Tax=Methylobacterium cerastii TaxID=932741 RepID=A0ABQ4QP51_9HYPH|nr:AAA family ATPase [Methylobacterium cerastii]GJD47022.1 hypothetical protein AFCDBAGC_4907 [Methylobacterium cerastii]